jgi:hypothetical protein
MPAYLKSVSSKGNEFAEARSHFERLIERLGAPGTMELTHDQLEVLVATDGRECLRLLYQGHLDARAAQERVEASVRNAAGDELTHRRKRKRPLLTVVGMVMALRTIYSPRRGAGLAPLDAELNLPLELYSHGLRRLAAIEAARGSFDGTVEAVERATGRKVPKRQVEELARRAARDFDDYYVVHEERPALASADALLILSLDGKGIVMREEALRAVTRRRAQRSKHKLQTRLSTGEKRDRKRMSTVAAVYDVAPHIRRASDILPSPGEERPPSQRPRPRSKRVWASLERSSEQVTQDLFAEALRRDPEQRRKWVVLLDGDRHQLGRVKEAAKQAGVKITVVIDFIHVLEYLWKAAWGFFDKGDAAAESWVLERARRILDGKSSDVAAGIGRSATLRAIPAEKRIAIDECIDYLKKKRTMLRYNQYLVEGLPISTGVIEGACRHLVVDRMDITGARWSLEGAEAILRLRSLRSSGDFDDYWRFHLGREHRRLHLAKYSTAAP